MSGRVERSKLGMGGSNQLIQCIYLTCFQDDYDALELLLSYSGIRIHRAESLDEADFILTVTGAGVLLSDTLFLDGAWYDALRMCACVHPCVSSFVIAFQVDREFVAGAVDLGACGVLWTPLQIARLRPLLEAAHEAANLRRQAKRADTSTANVPKVGAVNR